MFQRQYYVYDKKSKTLVCGVRGIKDTFNNIYFIDELSGDIIQDASSYFIKKNMHTLVYVGGKDNE